MAVVGKILAQWRGQDRAGLRDRVAAGACRRSRLGACVCLVPAVVDSKRANWDQRGRRPEQAGTEPAAGSDCRIYQLTPPLHSIWEDTRTRSRTKGADSTPSL